MKHPEHICRFNDEPQICECYDTGFNAGIETGKRMNCDLCEHHTNRPMTPGEAELAAGLDKLFEE